MSDLTETIARLRALRDAWDEAIESGPSSKIEDAYNAVTEAVMDDLDALLDAADPETLRFGAWFEGERHAVAADGVPYVLRHYDDFGGVEVCAGRELVLRRGRIEGLVVEDVAIEAAREHDRRRRGAK